MRLHLHCFGVYCFFISLFSFGDVPFFYRVVNVVDYSGPSSVGDSYYSSLVAPRYVIFTNGVGYLRVLNDGLVSNMSFNGGTNFYDRFKGPVMFGFDGTLTNGYGSSISVECVYTNQISGRVTVNGSPASGAVVYLSREAGGWWECQNMASPCGVDSNGVFVLKEVDPGEYALKAGVFLGGKYSEYEFTNTFVVSSGSVSGADLDISYGALGSCYVIDSLSGWSDPFGLDLVGMVFRPSGLHSDWWEIFVDVTGNYWFYSGIESAGESSFLSMRMLNGRRSFYNDTCYFPDAGVFTNTVGGSIVLRRVLNNSVSGRVTVNGKPATNSIVVLWKDEGWGLSRVGSEPVYTSSNGVWSSEGLSSGVYFASVGVVDGGVYLDYPLSNSVTLAASCVTGVDLDVVRQSRLVGTVPPVYYRFPPVGLRVELWKRSVDYSWTEGYYPPGLDPMVPSSDPRWGLIVSPELIPDNGWWWCVTPVDSVLTDSNGVFVVDNLECGDYQVRIFDPSGIYVGGEYEIHVCGETSGIFLSGLNDIDWRNYIPSGEIMFLNCRWSSSCFQFEISNCDSNVSYFVYAASSVAGLSDLSKCRQVGVISNSSGRVWFTDSSPVSSSGFYRVSSRPF